MSSLYLISSEEKQLYTPLPVFLSPFLPSSLPLSLPPSPSPSLLPPCVTSLPSFLLPCLPLPLSLPSFLPCLSFSLPLCLSLPPSLPLPPCLSLSLPLSLPPSLPPCLSLSPPSFLPPSLPASLSPSLPPSLLPPLSFPPLSPSLPPPYLCPSFLIKILSNKEKRHHYDTTGSVEETLHGSHQSSHDGFTVFQSGNGFQFHFRFPGGGGSTRKDDSITAGMFFDQVLPKSDRTPYLIYFYHEFCFECMGVDNVWAELKRVSHICICCKYEV